jgi:hypothetical protein
MSYTKRAGKLYDITRTAKEKCVVKLKRRHITIRSDEVGANQAEIDYKLTPFTTVIVSALPSNKKKISPNEKQAEPTLLTINELQQDANNQEVLRSLRFVCVNLTDAENWSQSIRYNGVTLVQAIFENKLNRHTNSLLHDDSTNEIDSLIPHKPMQQELVNEIIKTNQNNGLKRRNIKFCGYLIRRNHSQQRSFHHQQVYRKPSIIFVVLYSNGEIEFHHSHEMKRVADVVACRVDLIRENVVVVEVDGSDLSFALCVGDETRELFVTSDRQQKDLWINHLSDLGRQEPAKSPTTPENPAFVQETSPKTAEAIDLSQFGIDSDDEDGRTVIIHDKTEAEEVYIPGIGGSDDEGEGSIIVSRNAPAEEPNIFGNKKRGNIFKDEFWSAPAEMQNHHTVRTHIDTPKLESPTLSEPDVHVERIDISLEEEVRNLRDALLNRDREIDILKETLQKTVERLNELEVENKKIRSMLEKDSKQL